MGCCLACAQLPSDSARLPLSSQSASPVSHHAGGLLERSSAGDTWSAHACSFKVGPTYAQKFTSPDGTVTAQGIFIDSNPFITAYNSSSSGYHQQWYISHVSMVSHLEDVGVCEVLEAANRQENQISCLL